MACLIEAAALPLDHKGHRAGRARAAGERHGSTFPWILGELLSTEGLSNYVSAPAFAAAFTWSRSNRRTSHRSRSHGPTVSGAPRLRDYNSACSAIGAKKYRPALSRAVPSRHARKIKLGGVQALASARMEKQSHGSGSVHSPSSSSLSSSSLFLVATNPCVCDTPEASLDT